MKFDQNEKKHRQMTEEPIEKLIFRLALPSTVGMAVIALYSLADAFYVAKLGTEASAAVGVCFAIQALLQAVGYTLGMGAGSLLSRALGRRETARADTYSRIAFFLSLILGVLIGGIGLLFGNPLLRFLGADATVLPYAISYVRYLFISAPFMCGVFVLSQLLRAEGCAVYSMIGLTVGSLLNIVLDPLLIARLGISGASAATLISQAVSLAVLFSAYLLHHSRISLFKKEKTASFRDMVQIFYIGMPSALRQGLIVLATVLLNRKAGEWSAAALTAISVVSRLFLLAFSFCLGVGQGMMPIVGYNFGNGTLSRVRKAYGFSIQVSTIGMLVLGLIMFFIPAPLIAFFRNDPAVIEIGAVALRAQGAVLIFHGLITCTILLAQALGRPISASVLAAARQGFFFVPLLFLLPRILGPIGLLLVQPVADLLTFLMTIPFSIHLKKALQKDSAAPPVVELPRT